VCTEIVKNITFSADPELIEKAQLRARSPAASCEA
jgi:hypothetical protein